MAEVDIKIMYPVTYNNPQLTAKMLPSLEKVAGEDNVRVVKASTGAEDFSFMHKSARSVLPVGRQT